jgi:hypothetical protein
MITSLYCTVLGTRGYALQNTVVLSYNVPYFTPCKAVPYCTERFICFPDFNRAHFRAKTSVVDPDYLNPDPDDPVFQVNSDTDPGV